MKNLLDDAGYIEAVIRSIERLPPEVTEEIISRLRGDDRSRQAYADYCDTEGNHDPA